jgi:fucose 4-O-acetylase-like acetyltransferase
MKVNYLGIIAGIIVLTSLLLPWYTVTTTQTTSTGAQETAQFTVYLYQVTTNVNGAEQATELHVWLGLSTLILLTLTGVGCLIGSLRNGKKGRLILVFTGILALISVMTFGFSLQRNILAPQSAVPDYTASVFQSGTWQMASGFWVALSAGVLNLVSLPTHPMRQMLLKRPLENPVALASKEEKTN